MLLWEYLLRADNQNDLAEPSAGFEWFAAQWWMPKPVTDWWKDADREYWRQNVLAFRSLVTRLTSQKPKHKFPTDEHSFRRADKVLRKHLAAMKPVPHVLPRKGPKRDLLSRSNLLGFRLVPTMLRGDERVEAAVPEWWADASVFWQCVFSSFVTPLGLPPLCGVCGQPLPPSRGGKPSRRSRCQSCTYKAWRKKQTKAEMRERWREHKANAKP